MPNVYTESPVSIRQLRLTITGVTLLLAMLLLTACPSLASKPTVTAPDQDPVPTRIDTRTPISPADSPNTTDQQTVYHSRQYGYSLYLPSPWIIVPSTNLTTKTITHTLAAYDTRSNNDALQAYRHGNARIDLIALLPATATPTTTVQAQLTVSIIDAAGQHLTTYLTATRRELETSPTVTLQTANITTSLSTTGQPAVLITYSLDPATEDDLPRIGLQATHYQTDADTFRITTLIALPNRDDEWYDIFKRILTEGSTP